MDNLEFEAFAKLFKVEGEVRQGAVQTGGSILDGALGNLVSVTMNDQQGEIWRYSIATDGPGLHGPERIVAIAEKFGPNA